MIKKYITRPSQYQKWRFGIVKENSYQAKDHATGTSPSKSCPLLNLVLLMFNYTIDNIDSK